MSQKIDTKEETRVNEKDVSEETSDIIPERLPLMPLRDVVIFPYMVVPILVVRDASVAALQAALVNDRYVFLSLQNNPDDDTPNADEVKKTGVIGRTLQILKLPNGTAKVLVEGVVRGRILDSESREEYDEVTVEHDVRVLDDNPRTKAMMRNAVNGFTDYIKLSKSIPDEVIVNISSIEEPDRLADTIAAHMILRPESKQELLECETVEDQFTKLAAFLSEEIEIMELENSIDKEVKERLHKSQKDFYLHEQMRVIREELGEEDEDSEIEELEILVKKAGMPKEALRKALDELDKLRRMHLMSPESTVVRNYLDWLIGIPWKKRTRDVLDIKKAKQVLDEDHYGLDKPKERILEYLAVLKLAKKMRGPILCFCGPPGTGKTSLGRSVARALGRKFVRMSLGGVRDEAEIRGHRKTYIGSLPGRIIQNMKKAGTRNPVFLLDEVDKIGADFRGDPSSALLEVLDPEQNTTFMDHYLEVDYDLSEVMFITTANYEEAIPEPLLDRMEIIRLSGYLEFEKLGIAQRHLIPKQMEANGLSDRRIKFEDDAIMKIIRNYTAEAGVRNLERSIASVCRKVARQVVESKRKSEKKVISSRSVSKYLGVPHVHEKKISKANQIGVATGLAWTPVGGEILMIETAMMRGKGDLILTGHLGDVMKESARAALTYTKANMDSLGIDADALDGKDIHIHVPEGAIKKDGPSAGVALAVSLVSVASGRPISRNVAMTGEITLRGNVLPIGGLKEKALAAKRSGIKKVLIPKKNNAEYRDLPREIRDSLEFVLVNTIDEVIEQALA